MKIKILEVRTYRTVKVVGVNFLAATMPDLVAALNPQNHYSYLIQDRNNLKPYWVGFSDGMITIGNEIIERTW